jgi:hypothetical protein
MAVSKAALSSKLCPVFVLLAGVLPAGEALLPSAKPATGT